MPETATDSRPRPVVLCVLDGWGIGSGGADDAIAQGHTPNWDRFMAEMPTARLAASGAAVGLPDGQMGNSEVGHTTIGAGRSVLQALPRIDDAVADGSLSANPALGRLVDAARLRGGTCHLMGLLSPGGVHAHQDHIAHLARLLAGRGVRVAVHAFLDGRDTPPRSAAGHMGAFSAALSGVAGVSVATVGGRYWAMDRDTRWKRTARAYACLVDGAGTPASDPRGAIEASYAADAGDEFMAPAVIGGYAGMADGDVLLMANFRADRVRQILAALMDPDFDAFDRGRVVAFAAGAGMTEYSAELGRRLAALFPAAPPEAVLGRIVADAGLRQLRIAETEKYAHVTFFLNGGREDVFPGEERILVPSPRVATYDLAPEMSAPEVTRRLVGAIGEGRFDLIVVNYANGDMVGHTGKLDAARQAAETVDACLGRLETAVTAAGAVLLVTADHGNCETMRHGASGEEHTAHTLNAVPAVLVNPPPAVTHLRDGSLADIAPTVLKLLGLARPGAMTGRALADHGDADVAAAQ